MNEANDARSSPPQTPSILDRFKALEAEYGYTWDDDNNVPRRPGQTHRSIDEPIEDSSTAVHKKAEEHGDLCFCNKCMS